jgi:Tol biopolymer transport system component
VNHVQSKRVLFLVVALAAAPSAEAGEIQLISKGYPAAPPDTPVLASRLASGQPTSDDGRYVLFVSAATNLVPGQDDTNGRDDLFLADRATGETVLVTHVPASPTRTSNSWGTGTSGLGPAIVSGTGRFVAFASSARDLVPGQTGATSEIFLFDRLTLEVTLVTHRPGAPTEGAGGGEPRGLSDDGRFLAFQSGSTQLVAGVTGGPSVYLYDRITGSNALISHVFGLPTRAVYALADYGCLSGDGRRLAFRASFNGYDNNLVPGQTGPGSQTFLYDAATNAIALVSHSPGSPSTGGDWQSPMTMVARISRDGSHVAFTSWATNLVAGFVWKGAEESAYLYSVATGTVSLASHAASSTTDGANSESQQVQISGDGRTMVFRSLANNLVSGVTGWNIYAFDRITQAVTLVSRNVASGGAGGQWPSVSLDGNKILFSSAGQNLVPGQVAGGANPQSQAYVFDLGSRTMAMASHTTASPATPSGAGVSAAALSGDGGSVVFVSAAPDLTGGRDFNGADDVLAYQTSSGATTIVSRLLGQANRAALGRSDFPGRDVVGYPTSPVLSSNGRHVLFSSLAANLLASPTGPAPNLFLADRFTGVTRLVTHAPGDPNQGIASNVPLGRVSGDGGHVAFLSNSVLTPDAIPGASWHCYLWDRLASQNHLLANACAGVGMDLGGRFVAYVVAGQIHLLDASTGDTQLVTRRWGTTSTPANGTSTNPVVSADGHWVGYSSQASDLTASATTGSQVFLFDARTGTNTLVSHRATSAAEGGLGTSAMPALNADGSYVAFVSSATDLVSGQVDQADTSDIFLFHRATGVIQLVSHSASDSKSAAGDQNVYGSAPLLSDEGRYVAFLFSGRLSSGLGLSAYLFDRVTDTNSLVSFEMGSPTTQGTAIDVMGMSADGSKVTFSSQGSLVVGGVPDDHVKAFVYDRLAGNIALASGAGSSPTTSGNGHSYSAGISRDGAVVAFSSEASNLVGGDLNEARDVFVYTTAAPLPPTYQGFHTVVPCRLVDTRLLPGDWGGPAINAGYDRSFVAAGRCGVPTSAKAVSLNLTVTSASTSGNLRLFAAGAAPFASAINYRPGQTRANSALTYLGPSGELTVRSDQASGTVDVIIDLNGYFE